MNSDTGLPEAPHTKLALILYWAAVVACCAWILSMPVFPSQDGPLHLYYVHAFGQVLAHRAGVYSQAYSIRNYLPPYSTYYYGLLALSSVMSLEQADKVFACLCVVLFAAGVRAVMKAVGLRNGWSSLWVLPVLVSWPLLEGLLSYLLALDLGFFAIAAWCRCAGRPAARERVAFLVLVVLIALTHAEPWAVVVGFAWLELACRFLLRRERSGDALKWDIVTAILACTPFFYLRRYKATGTREVDFVDYAARVRRIEVPPGFRQQLGLQWHSLTHAYGLTVMNGPGLSGLYTNCLELVLFCSFGLALWFAWKQARESQSYWQRVWVILAVLLSVALILVPDRLGGAYFFVTRLQIVFFVVCVIAVSYGLERCRRLALAGGVSCVAILVLVLFLAARHISPVAREIASLKQLPASSTEVRSGLIMRPARHRQPELLAFQAMYWAPAHYLRWHDYLLYNTPWLGDPIIPLTPRPESAGRLDASFYNLAPEYRMELLQNEATAKAVLDRVDFVLMPRLGVPPTQNPFAENPGDKEPGDFSVGWGCMASTGGVWYLCRRAGAF